jgi:hypothetical protein
MYKIAFRLSRVWKQSSSPSKEYMKGWNDCIKQQKQNEKQYVEYLEEMWKEIREGMWKEVLKDVKK